MSDHLPDIRGINVHTAVLWPRVKPGGPVYCIWTDYMNPGLVHAGPNEMYGGSHPQSVCGELLASPVAINLYTMTNSSTVRVWPPAPHEELHFTRGPQLDPPVTIRRCPTCHERVN